MIIHSGCSMSLLIRIKSARKLCCNLLVVKGFIPRYYESQKNQANNNLIKLYFLHRFFFLFLVV